MNSQANDTADKSVSTTATQALDNLVTIGRLWATHGLEVGRSVLVSSAESLKLVAETLADVKSRVSGETSDDDAPKA